MLGALAPKSWRYKPGYEDGGEREHTGVMAQALEKSDLGRTMVRKDADGTRIVDYSPRTMGPIVLAALAQLVGVALQPRAKVDEVHVAVGVGSRYRRTDNDSPRWSRGKGWREMVEQVNGNGSAALKLEPTPQRVTISLRDEADLSWFFGPSLLPCFHSYLYYYGLC